MVCNLLVVNLWLRAVARSFNAPNIPCVGIYVGLISVTKLIGANQLCGLMYMYKHLKYHIIPNIPYIVIITIGIINAWDYTLVFLVLYHIKPWYLRRSPLYINGDTLDVHF